MRLCEMHNFLKLPVFLFSFLFSFFCQPIPGIRNCKSVFLILKIFKNVGPKWRFQLFQMYSCINAVSRVFSGINIRTGISISIRPMSTKFSKQWVQGSWLKWDLSSRCCLRYYVKITWQTKTIISPLHRYLWPPNVTGRWII